MPVRVLWLTKGLGPGGAERLLVEIARRTDPERVLLTGAYVLPWKDHLAGELEAAGVRTVCLSRHDRDLRWPLRLRSLLAEADIVHAHSPVPAVAARIAARTLPVAQRPVTMSTEHNTWTSHHFATRWANRLTGGLDAATIAVTDEARRTVTGSAATRVEVLTHGIDVDAVRRRRGERDRVRAELGLGDRFVIGTVANLRPQKDYPNLLAAARNLVDRGLDVRILAVGQGPLEAEITRRRDGMGLAGHVDLLGFRADAVDVMAACDAFVLASAWEGLPVAVMEALALGLPVVATAVGGVAESLDERSVLLVPPGDPAALADALATVVANSAERQRLADASRQLASRFDVGHVAATLTERYETLARGDIDRASGLEVSHEDDRGGGSVARSGPGPDAAMVDRPSRAPDPASLDGPRPARRPGDVEIRPMETGHLPAVLALLRESLGWADDDRSAALFAWKHLDNPFGPSAGWVATYGQEVVAVRLFMRWRFRRGRATISAVRAIDTATHPDHRGRGLFTALTMTAVESCSEEGVDWVFNTPNDQSRPGYLKMGWRVVGRLPAAMCPTALAAPLILPRSRAPADRWSVPIDVGADVDRWLAAAPGHLRPAGGGPSVSSSDRGIHTAWDDDALRWRYSLPDLHYRVVDDGDAAVIVRLRMRGAARELVVARRFGNPGGADSLAGRIGREVGATYVLRLGPPDVRRGYVPLPGGGPVLTWRGLTDLGPPPLPNWRLELGDIELF